MTRGGDCAILHIRITFSNERKRCGMYGKKGFCLLLALAVLCVGLLSACGKKTETGTSANTLVTEELLYVAEGVVYRRTVYTYDDNGNLTEQVSYDFEGNEFNHYTYAYDERGNKTEEVNHGKPVEIRTTYVCNEHGDATQVCVYNGDVLTESYTYTYTYDEHGNKTEQIEYDADGSPVWRLTYEYTYDESGRITSQRESLSEDLQSDRILHDFAYAYDESGNLKEYSVCDSDGTEVRHYTYTYDENGRLTEEALRLYGKEPEKTTYAYDEYGRKALKTDYSRDGTKVSWTEYRYD